MNDIDWSGMVKGMLKAEIKRRNLTYESLSARLADYGVRETPQNLRTKISRGGFSAVFFIQCMKAVGCQTLRIDETS
jgi:hypothetical protein